MFEITSDFVWQAIQPRPRDAHKGTFGSVLAVAGSASYRGAAALAVEGALGVPVIQIKIVQQRTHGQRGLVGVQVQAAVEPEADQRHIFAVLIGGHRAMLDILPHLLHLGVVIVFLHDLIKLFAFCFRKLHSAKFPFASTGKPVK